MRPDILNPVFADITALPGIGPKLAALLARLAGPRVVDLAFMPPISVIDRSARPTLAAAPLGEVVTVEVHIDRHDPPPARKRPYRIICSDETGFLTLVFFNPRKEYLERTLPEGERRIVSGRIEQFGASRQMAHPDHIVALDKVDDLPLFEPVYPGLQGLSRAVVRRAVASALARLPDLPEWQDAAWLAKNSWASWRDALLNVHAPKAAADLSPAHPARQRVAYDELLANQLALALVRRATVRTKGRSLGGDGSLTRPAIDNLPFSLTGGQLKALKDIGADMRAPDRMIRLLQGDVGSGKTVVAFLAMLRAVESGAQAALMAPTEILTRQHFEHLAPMAEALGVRAVLLTGRDQGRERAAKLAAIQAGKAQLVFGTHSLFQDDVDFHDLGLAVVDEQHRFGVHQRLALSGKSPTADLLVMTATPIPRTLALTVYGEMSCSELREKPAGRKPISTRAIPDARTEEVIDAVRRAVAAGEQAYWVCPLVAPSDEMPAISAQDRFEALRAVFGERVGLVHGKMPAAEKDEVVRAFHEKRVLVLVATTVIEVGVNAPNATLMVIENAERFGLAQLHQLRGRVGRGDKASACVLLYRSPLGETAEARLRILRETEDGFRIAEEDLRLRGAGDLLGAQQSGMPLFRLADIASHADLLEAARDDARLVLERDPKLTSPRGLALKTLLYLFSRDEAVRLIRAG